MNLSIQTAIRWGIISALLSILVFIIPYILGSTLIYSIWYGIAIMLLCVVYIVLTARDFRAQQNGVASFSELFQTTLMAFALMSIILSLFNFIFYNYIDITFANTLKQHVLDNTQAMMERFDTPEEAIEEAISGIEAQDFSMTPYNVLLGAAKTIAGGAVGSFFVALIMQRKGTNNA